MSEETKLILEALGKISDKIEEMDKRLSNVEDKVIDIQLTLETETIRKGGFCCVRRCPINAPYKHLFLILFYVKDIDK